MIDTIRMSFELPRTIFSALRQEPEEFISEMRLAAAVKWYENKQISQSKAAEIAGLSRAEFLAALVRFNVSPFQVTTEELLQEISNA